jgi:hypothetical protein
MSDKNVAQILFVHRIVGHPRVRSMEDRLQPLLQRGRQHQACFGVVLAGQVDHAGTSVGPLPQPCRATLSLEA